MTALPRGARPSGLSGGQLQGGRTPDSGRRRQRLGSHDGFDGVFLDLPGTRAHLELVCAPHCAPPQPHPETLLVLCLGSWDAVHERVRQGQLTTVPAANPYWDLHGITVTDPDGWRVVLCADQGLD
jgi:hypothetical protein